MLRHQLGLRSHVARSQLPQCRSRAGSRLLWANCWAYLRTCRERLLLPRRRCSRCRRRWLGRVGAADPCFGAAGLDEGGEGYGRFARVGSGDGVADGGLVGGGAAGGGQQTPCGAVAFAVPDAVRRDGGRVDRASKGARMSTATVTEVHRGGAGQGTVALAAACMPILGSTSIAPLQPTMAAAFPDQPGAAVLASLILTAPALVIGLTALSLVGSSIGSGAKAGARDRPRPLFAGRYRSTLATDPARDSG